MTQDQPSESRGRPGWGRLAVTVALIGAMSAAAMLSPVSAASRNASKSFVRKMVDRKINQFREEVDQSFRETRMNASSTQVVGPVQVTGFGTDVVLATLALPGGGNYVVNAKLWWNVTNATSTGVGGEIDCDLLAGSDFDTSRESGVTDFDYGTLSLQLSHVASGLETVVLRCRDEFQGGNPVEVHNIVITAVEVFALAATSPGRTGPSDPDPVATRP